MGGILIEYLLVFLAVGGSVYLPEEKLCFPLDCVFFKST